MGKQANPAEAAVRAGPAAVFDLLAARLGESAGFKLLTLLTLDEDGARLVRPFSSRPDQFPCGAADPVENTRWFRRLFVEQEAVIANDGVSIRSWLPQFTNAAVLGYDSLLNLPIVVAGKVLGLINVMDGRDHFDSGRVEAIRNEMPLAALAILARSATVPTISLPETGSD